MAPPSLMPIQPIIAREHSNFSSFQSFTIEKYSFAKQPLHHPEPANVPWQHHPSRDGLYLVFDHSNGKGFGSRSSDKSDRGLTMKVIWKSQTLEDIDVTGLVNKNFNRNMPSINVIVRSPCIAIKYVDLQSKENCRLQVKFPDENSFIGAKGFFERAGCNMRNAGPAPVVPYLSSIQNGPRMQHSQPQYVPQFNPQILHRQTLMPYETPNLEHFDVRHPSRSTPLFAEQVGIQPNHHSQIRRQASVFEIASNNEPVSDHIPHSHQRSDSGIGTSQYASNSQPSYDENLAWHISRQQFFDNVPQHPFALAPVTYPSLSSRPTSRANNSRGSVSSGTLDGCETAPTIPMVTVQQHDDRPPPRELPDFDAYNKSNGKKPLPGSKRLDTISEGTSPDRSNKRQRVDDYEVALSLTSKVTTETAEIGLTNAKSARATALSTVTGREMQNNGAENVPIALKGFGADGVQKVLCPKKSTLKMPEVTRSKENTSLLTTLTSQFAISDPQLMETLSNDTFENIVIDFIMDDANIAFVERFQNVMQVMGLAKSKTLFANRGSL